MFKKAGLFVRSVVRRRSERFIFIHINKTGGSSIEKALGIPSEHKTALEKIEEVGQGSWNRSFTFTVVRNPWDKVVSHYHYRVKTNQTGLGERPIGFEEWVKRTYGAQDRAYYDFPRMFMPQVDWISDRNGVELVDKIVYFERLEEGFQEVLEKLGRSATLPHLKKSDRGDYRDYYDEETRAIVERWFERDIAMFGYRF